MGCGDGRVGMEESRTYHNHVLILLIGLLSFLFNKYSLTPKALQTVGLRVFQTSVIGAPSSQLLAKAMKQNDVLNP